MLTLGSGGLISVEGIDASGKSTVARRLVDALAAEGHEVALLDRRTAVAATQGYVADHLAGLRQLIWEYPPDAVTSELGFGHWAALIGAWFHAVDHTVVRPALAAGRWLVADSWYFMFAARFALTVGATKAAAPFAGVTRPHSSIWLDVDPRECVGRRDRPRPTESGEWHRMDTGASSFIAYQDRVRAEYRMFASAGGWLRLESEDEEHTLHCALQYLRDEIKELSRQ
jgi:thymidylate kinase